MNRENYFVKKSFLKVFFFLDNLFCLRAFRCFRLSPEMIHENVRIKRTVKKMQKK